MSPRNSAALWVVMLALTCPQFGCQREEESQTTRLLAEAPANETKFSSYEPKNPFHKAAEHLLERTVFEAPGPQGLRLEVRDLFVVPGTTAQKISLPGPAMLQVLGGEGRITIGDKVQELKSGTPVSLSQDATCALESRGITPLVLRARIFVP